MKRLSTDELRAEIARLRAKAKADYQAILDRGDEATNAELDAIQLDLDAANASEAQLKIELGLADADERQNTPLYPKRIHNASAPAPMLHEMSDVDIERQLDSVVVPRKYRTSNLHGFQLNGESLDDAQRRAYVSGRWILGALFGRPQHREWCLNHGMDPACFQLAGGIEGSNTAGGALVPEELSSTIIDLREQYGVFRQRVRVWPMNSDTLTIPVRATGLTAYYGGEQTDMSANESEMGWGQVGLGAKKLYCYTKWSNELDEDAIVQLANILSSEIAYAFAYKEDDTGFNGTGLSTYGGILGLVPKIGIASGATYAGSIVEAVAGNTGFGTLDLEDFEAVVGRLPQYAENGAAWYISKVGYAASMMRLALASGGTTRDDIAGGTGLQFLGYPVVISQVLNSTLGADTSKIKCLFGRLDLAVAMGERRGLGISVSPWENWKSEQMTMKGSSRFDINCHSLGDATNAGPIIALKTPGA